MLEGTANGPTVLAGAVHGGVHFHQGDPATGQAPVPRQLLASPGHFVGRDAELAELDRIVADSADHRSLVLLTGVGGVGKSALALYWSQRVSGRFPAGQLYVNLGAFGPAGPVAPGDVLGQFLRALGVAPERVPADPAEQAGLFRSLTAEMRLLVLLDNALSAAQVRPLLPTSTRCLVVVTARWRLGSLIMEGARFVPIGPLDEQAATDLLARVVGEQRVTGDEAGTSSLVRLCGGLPIALSVTGARLASRPAWPLRRVVTELDQEHRRLANLSTQEDLSVRATFDLSYQSLPAPAARCYRLLGLHPGAEFGVEVAAAALDAEVDEAGGLLDTLVEASLLNEIGEDRYRFHDLIRLHARQQADDDPERDRARGRIVEWYLAGTRAADLLLTPYRQRPPDVYVHLAADVVVLADRDEALDWLERERTNLVATIRDAAEVWPEQVYQMVDAMWPLFHYRRHHQTRMEVDELAVECARRLGNQRYAGMMTMRWAYAHFDLHRIDEAGRLFEQSLVILSAVGDRYEQAGCLGGLGVVALAQRRFADAAIHFARQLEIYREAGDHRNVGLTLFRLGLVDSRSGQAARAVEHFTAAAEAFGEAGGADPYNAARTRIELGRALGRTGQQERGAGQLRQALAEMTRLQAPRGRAQALHGLGELALGAGDDAEAAARLGQALEIYEQLGDTEAAEVRQLAGTIPSGGAGADQAP